MTHIALARPGWSPGLSHVQSTSFRLLPQAVLSPTKDVFFARISSRTKFTATGEQLIRLKFGVRSPVCAVSKASRRGGCRVDFTAF